MIKDLLNKHIGKAFDGVLSGAVKEFTGTRKPIKTSENAVDEWVSDDETETTTTEPITYTGRGVFSGYKEEEINGQTILSTDVQLICLQDEVSDTPQEDDVIDGYVVQIVKKDPVNATYKIQLRKV